MVAHIIGETGEYTYVCITRVVDYSLSISLCLSFFLFISLSEVGTIYSHLPLLLFQTNTISCHGIDLRLCFFHPLLSFSLTLSLSLFLLYCYYFFPGESRTLVLLRLRPRVMFFVINWCLVWRSALINYLKRVYFRFSFPLISILSFLPECRC